MPEIDSLIDHIRAALSIFFYQKEMKTSCCFVPRNYVLFLAQEYLVEVSCQVHLLIFTVYDTPRKSIHQSRVNTVMLWSLGKKIKKP